MKKILILLIFLTFSSQALAVQKVFYDRLYDRHIIDVSGVKTIGEIARDYGVPIIALQEIIIDEKKESAYLENGNLKKKNFVVEQEQKNEEKKAQKKIKKDKMKVKLKLSEAEWKDLQEALR